MTGGNEARYETGEIPKAGLWEILTCRSCQTREDAFSGVDDSIHVMLHEKKKKKKVSGNKKDKLSELEDPLQVSTHGRSKVQMPIIPDTGKNGSA
jgi:hypothetical protein